MDQEDIKAMLAHKYNEDKADYPAFIQPKLDGVRCLFTKSGAFSRANNRFMNVEHIEQALKPFFAKNPTTVLDGELYNHGLKDDFEKNYISC
jgi:DNA ligase-1